MNIEITLRSKLGVICYMDPTIIIAHLFLE